MRAATAPGVANARIVIGASGVAVLGYAAFLGLTTVAPAQYPAVLWWLIGAIVVHDGVLAPLVVAFGVLGRGTSERIGPRAAAVARAWLVAAACCSLVLVPGLVVRATGARNPTIHAVDYPLVLVGLWVAAVCVAAAAVLIGRRGATARTK